MLKTLDCKVLLTDGSRELPLASELTPQTACEMLERGGILYFPETPFRFSDADREFLLTQRQKDADYHKNIAYRPRENRITGVDSGSGMDVERLRVIMSDFHDQVIAFLKVFLAPYAKSWHIDFASYRPLEERGRKMRLRARNDLLHVDSFATRPIYGDRILRAFININPEQNRIWNTSDNFEVLVNQFRTAVPPPSALNAVPSSPTVAQRLLKALGMRANRNSPYDRFMLDFHNFLKENAQFQTSCRKDLWEFPPNSSWIVFTDMVSHAVLSGQFALEQTMIISQRDLVTPEKAPINILRKLYDVKN